MKTNRFAALCARVVQAAWAGVQPSSCADRPRPAARSAGLLLLSALAWLATTPAFAQSLPLEIRQDATRYNLASTNGMPISITRGTPPGSDGRGPTLAQQQSAGLTTVPATINQFQSFVTFGALAVPPVARRTSLNSNISYFANAENLDLPRGKVNNQVVIVMPRVRVGSPFISRSVSFLFGASVPVPVFDEFRVLLSIVNTGVTPNRPIQLPEDYWLPEPYSTTGHTNTGYYWSPHAQAVFAVNPGPLRVAWRRSVSSTNANPPSGVGTVLVLGVPYVVFTNQYLVSGSPVKPPRLMYWTEKSFGPTGKPVSVPAARVGAVNVVYNNAFPERVASEVVIPGAAPITTSNTLQELRTLWFDQTGGQAGGQIRAYNAQGRVFMELLGDVRPNETRRHLGLEIVDVIRQPNASDVTTELGERLTAYANGAPDDARLVPEPVLQVGQTFTFQFSPSGSSRPTFYATRETVNLNDLQVHWLEEGLEGLRWPFLFVRYKLVWPEDVTKYSHYIRPNVATEEEAKATAVLLPTENAPIIDYQDPFDQPRGKLTETFAYYSWLTPEYPVHRALLRFSSAGNIRFERVLSWLDENLKNNSFANTIATSLSTWNTNSQSFDWPPGLPVPRVIQTAVSVGDRIAAPNGEAGGDGGTNYLSGYILQSQGTSFSPPAYADPFTAGFEAANRGAIIPVNAIPEKNRLEVWWFRKNQVNATQGFKNTYWPAVIGRYTLQWPAAPAEIVLASNDGSGPLSSLQAKGSIYFQNDKSQPGYNPNEEHALVQGGQAFALRDDLNLTSNTNNEYSSQPFVLLSYPESDGRPAIRPFKVLREKPEAGIVFDYPKEAGAILQPPMPLPLLEKPLAPRLPGDAPKSLNTEIDGSLVASSTRVAGGAFTSHQLTTTGRHFVKPYNPVALQDPLAPQSLNWFFPTNVAATTLGGWVSAVRPLRLSAWGGAQNALATRWRFSTALPDGLRTNVTALLYDTVAKTNWLVTVTEANAASQYVEVQFTGTTPPPARSADILVMTVGGPGANGFAGQRMGSEPLATDIVNASLRERYASFTLQDRKANTWIYRGPHDLDEDPVLVMRYYYKTLPGFHFPTLALADQPPVGTVTPYLRGRNPDGSFEGDPVFGNRVRPNDGDAQPLGITYRPVWPDNVAVLQMAETLLTPKRGLPAVRGQTSLEIVYQQSQISGGEEHESAVLHDPTREKSFTLGAPDDADTLDRIPASVKTQSFQGKTYFPNLPPHLAERVFLDPNRGQFGSLVFKGQFVDAALGDKYVLLNVLGPHDSTVLKALCSSDDERKAKWDAAVDGFSTTLETFIENAAQPGTYIPSAPEVVDGAGLSRVRNDDVAVDSYALTARGPGVGYVSLIAGNGRAFTPEGDPVSVKIIKVVDTLYRGEVNIVESSNPLNETLTLQQVIDLAGQAGDYNFEWRIASPVDGLPPVVYQNTPVTLMSDGTWNHLRHPLPGDTAVSAPGTAANRLVPDVSTTVSPVTRVQYDSVVLDDGKFRFRTSGAQAHGLSAGNQLVLRKAGGGEVFGTVHALTTASDIFVAVDPGQNTPLASSEIVELAERVVTNGVQSIVFRQFVESPGNYSQYWLSLNLDDALGAVVYLDGQLAVTANTGAGDSTTTTPPAGIVPLSRIYRLSSALLAGGALNPDGSRTHTIAVELHSGAFAGQFIAFNARLEAFTSVDVTAQQWLPLDPIRYQDGVRAVLGGSADVRSLADNYLIMRYQAKNSDHASYVSDGNGGNARWSQWTTPQLAEGWIKRVLKGINPFNQRITDLFNNSVNTDVSIVAQAGGRWEGDVALNLDTLNSAGLIEIYETVLNRGKLLSIGGGINYGPANDALLLAAGYLNDLYMVLGNEAWADAANPTIGIGTKDNTYGSIATALFSFRGQLPSLLEEELALLRGRDDFLLPGVELRPVYNRMIWNYTRGIDAGEVIYALNYNVLDQNTDGVVNAEDARRLYPQGHGDAYGHYLTALKGYYALLMDNNFDWVPRIEAVTVLGKPVSVDYQDERKFAAAAAALARAGKQTFDLTWRRDYQSGAGNGWSHFAAIKANLTTRNVPTTRYWGLDHWASRTGQGTFLNWIVGNAIVPDHDPDPSHKDSIQQVDRTTVPELKELVAIAGNLQTAMDNAEAGHTPLGLPSTTIPFDLNPNTVVAQESTTHFEQIYQRATRALNNAVTAFDDAKDVTRLMRSEQDSLADFRTTVNKQELAYTNTLIELYGTPYPEDIGPGKTYRTGFNGPDTLHYTYVDEAEITFGGLLTPRTDYQWNIDTQTFSPGWANGDLISTFNFVTRARNGEVDGLPATHDYVTNTSLYVSYNLSSHGFFEKPEAWTSRRASPGKIQQAISDIVKARNAAYTAFYWADAAKYDLDWAIVSFEQKQRSHKKIRGFQTGIVTADEVLDAAKLAYEIYEKYTDQTKDQISVVNASLLAGIPESFIAGLAAGGDLTSPARAAIFAAAGTVQSVTEWSKVIAFSVVRSLDFANATAKRFIEFNGIAPEEFNQELRDATSEIRDKVYGMNNFMMGINARLQELDDARRKYRALLAEGDRIQAERQIFRQRAAAVIQGFRTRDAAFRIFRNEKLERYKTLFDLAAQYSFMAAQAYDYETGLLHTEQGRDFINRIVRARALGIVQNGQPQFAGSNTGDPGLSSAMAEMFADWSVAKGRLGFNNPDAYGTTVSLRTEHFRILPGTNGSANWTDVLNQARKANIFDDADVRRYCLQLNSGNGLPVPGLVLEFSTTIADGFNLFGRPLAAGDHR